jgi:hypothetical protein
MGLGAPEQGGNLTIANSGICPIRVHFTSGSFSGGVWRGCAMKSTLSNPMLQRK